MRSVAVVFPASMCAMIPMFRQRFRGTVRATATTSLRVHSTRDSKLQQFNNFGCPILAAFLFLRLGWEPNLLRLPAVVGKGLVGLGHAVHVFLLLYCRAAPLGRIQQLVAQLVGH